MKIALVVWGITSTMGVVYSVKLYIEVVRDLQLAPRLLEWLGKGPLLPIMAWITGIALMLYPRMTREIGLRTVCAHLVGDGRITEAQMHEYLSHKK